MYAYNTEINTEKKELNIKVIALASDSFLKKGFGILKEEKKII